MKDSWLNIGYSGDELKPYIEPETSIDEKRICKFPEISLCYWSESSV